MLMSNLENNEPSDWSDEQDLDPDIDPQEPLDPLEVDDTQSLSPEQYEELQKWKQRQGNKKTVIFVKVTIEHECLLCGHERKRTMKVDLDTKKKWVAENLLDKNNTYHSKDTTCPFCSEHLIQVDKETLVSMLIEQAKKLGRTPLPKRSRHGK